MQGVFKSGDKAGGVGDPATGLALMWMNERPDGSIDPSVLTVTVNVFVNPVFFAESDTAIRVRMIRDLDEPRAKAITSFWYIAGIEGSKPPGHPEVLKFYAQASAANFLARMVQYVADSESLRSWYVDEFKVAQ